MIDKALESLGLTQNEATLFKQLVASGSSKAGDLAKQLGINRPSVYASLDSLVLRGLVSKTQKGPAILFTAQDPERLLDYIDREEQKALKEFDKKRQAIQDSLVELKTLPFQTGDRPRVQLFEGNTGMREAYEDTLTARDGILAYANVETMHEGLPYIFPDYYHRRSELNIHILAILPDNSASRERAKHDREEIRTSRFLPNTETFTPEINIYNHKVLMVSWKEKIAILIESREIANFHKIMFEQIWETLRK